jgi:membrane protein implicated in regulation of membrane protease activity
LSALQTTIPADPTQILWLLIVLIVIGLIAIVVLGFLFAFPIAVVASITVWFLTGGDLFLTGLTFMITALITASIGRLWNATTKNKEQTQNDKNNENKQM